MLIQYNNITQMLTSLHRVYLSAAWTNRCLKEEKEWIQNNNGWWVK